MPIRYEDVLSLVRGTLNIVRQEREEIQVEDIADYLEAREYAEALAHDATEQ